MQAYKLELASYNISCPHYKRHLQQVAFSREKAGKPKKQSIKFNHHGVQKMPLKYPPIFGYQI